MIIVESAPSQVAAVPKSGEFLHRLESLRGIAALMVAGGHSFVVLAVQGWQAPICKWATAPLNGHAAVTLFFVLSGLVLGRSLARGNSRFFLNYATFGLRRFFRICPAFIVGTCLIAGSMLWLNWPMNYSEGVSKWFAGHWNQALTPKLFLSNLFFLNNELNPPSWTLRAELVCSMALPALFFISVRVGWLGRSLVLLGLMVWEVLGHGNLSAWLFMFYLGLLLPDTAPFWRRLFGSKPNLSKWIPVLAWIVLCVEFKIFYDYQKWGNLLEGLTATLFISALLYGPELSWFRIYDWAPTRFYGRISYSFYLYHMVCLYFTSKAAFMVLGMDNLAAYAIPSALLLLLVSVAVATLVAWLSYRYIENPGIAFSKRLCRILEGWFPGTKTPLIAKGNTASVSASSPTV